MSKNNAVILAAGGSADRISNDFDVPKALYRVGGQTLIERQICQLKEAGIADITVIVGYKKEQLLFLEDKYGVRLIVNKAFSSKGNLYSLYLAREYIADTYVCFCDNYFPKDLFTSSVESESYRICCRREGSSEFYVKTSPEGRITSVTAGNLSGLAMTGFAYFTKDFSEKFFELLERQIALFGTDKLFWEEFLGRNLDALSINAREVPAETVSEFDTLSELKDFSTDLVEAVDSKILGNISGVLRCRKDEISNVELIDKGLTNVSFKFTVKGEDYIYRHPGNTSSKFSNREAEYFAQSLAKELGVDDSFIAMNVNQGWKLARFMPGCFDFSYDDETQLKTALGLLKRLHDSGRKSPFNFDPFYEAERLLNLASHGSQKFLDRFKELRAMVRRLYLYTELEGVPKVVCHNDAYAVNFLVNKDSLNIIDWEYSGNNDPAYDLGCIVVRDDITKEQAEHFIEVYLGRKPTFEEHRHFIACFALAGWYWFCWCLAKNGIGDDFGWWYLNSYHAAKRYGKMALELMENQDK